MPTIGRESGISSIGFWSKLRVLANYFTYGNTLQTLFT
jgi:hypothetical protein